jgi:hypothetical protein
MQLSQVNTSFGDPHWGITSSINTLAALKVKLAHVAFPIVKLQNKSVIFSICLLPDDDGVIGLDLNNHLVFFLNIY